MSEYTVKVEHFCTMLPTTKIRAVRVRVVSYGGNGRTFDRDMIDGIEQHYVCTECLKTEWRPVEEIIR